MLYNTVCVRACVRACVCVRGWAGVPVTGYGVCVCEGCVCAGCGCVGCVCGVFVGVCARRYLDADRSMLELVFAPCSPLAGGNVNWISKR